MSEKNRLKGRLLSLIKEAIQVNKKPFPWLKALSAGLAASIPVLVGLLFDNFQYGLLAGLGGFSYLYVFNIPYAQRAKKIFAVVLGLTIVTYLGTLSAPYPLAIAILMGLIGAFVVFIFGALKIAGPSAIFFVLVFAMTTGMPIQPDEALFRAGLVFFSGMFSFLLSMLGWFYNPHGPEIGAVMRIYYQLSYLFDAVGTDKFIDEKYKMMDVLDEAEETLSAGYIPWRTTNLFNRLYILNSYANEIFLNVIEKCSNRPDPLPKELGESTRLLAHSLDDSNNRTKKTILQPENLDDDEMKLFSAIYHAETVLNEPISKIEKTIKFDKPSLKTIFLGAFDKNSIVFLSAVRFGFITIIAAIIAFQFEFVRSYWVPLSCVAVISGATIVSTFHRTLQRFFGTVIGIALAGFILSLDPSPYAIVLIIFALTSITELFIVKNYGLAALFFTPNALIMAESTSQHFYHFSYFAEARLIDVVIGSVIGLIGVFIIGRKSASSRLPHVVSKTIRSQAQFFYVLFSDQGKNFDVRNSRERLKMRTNINNLETLYQTASGEIPAHRERLDYYWGIVFSIKHLGYLLEKCSKENQRPNLSNRELARILYVFETMANVIIHKVPFKHVAIPNIEMYSSIQEEIEFLQKEVNKIAK